MYQRTRADLHCFRLLRLLERGRIASQRALSRELGLALGFTNVLLRRLVRRGCVDVVRVGPQRASYYLLTPAGVAEKARLSQRCLEHVVHLYREATCDIRACLRRLSAEWDGGPEPKRVAFYGAGALCDLAFVCLRDTDLELVIVVDPDADGASRFFDVPVMTPMEASAAGLARTFDRLVVTALADSPSVLEDARVLGVAPPHVVFLWDVATLPV